MKPLTLFTFTFCVLLAIVAGCDTNKTIIGGDVSNNLSQNFDTKVSSVNSDVVIPGPLADISVNGEAFSFWPYTGTNFSGAPQDPVNLIFLGNADPTEIRAALMSLDGDRTAFGLPDQAPFNSIWTDAIGDVQTGYGNECGWTGGAVQLACGGYGPVRFHIRLFRMNGYTVANAHFELLIPGTTDHQVLSWELAEQFVMIDFVRSGLLGAEPSVTNQINEPNFHTIPAVIYNLLPVELRAAIGGPLGDVTSDVPRPSDGHATILYLAGAYPVLPDYQVQDFVVNFGQAVPKPFCADDPYDYLYVTGPVHLVQTTEINENGKYIMTFEAEGELTVVPINPLTGEPTGEPMTASVKERHSSQLDDNSCTASSWLFQKLLPANSDEAGSLTKRLRINSNGNFSYTEDGDCRSDLNLANNH